MGKSMCESHTWYGINTPRNKQLLKFSQKNPNDLIQNPPQDLHRQLSEEHAQMASKHTKRHPVPLTLWETQSQLQSAPHTHEDGECKNQNHKQTNQPTENNTRVRMWRTAALVPFDGNGKRHSHAENTAAAPQNVRNRITTWSSNSPSGSVKSAEIRASTRYLRLFTHRFTVASSTVTKMWKQPTCPPKGEPVRVRWCIHIIKKYYSTLKK